MKGYFIIIYIHVLLLYNYSNYFITISMIIVIIRIYTVDSTLYVTIPEKRVLIHRHRNQGACGAEAQNFLGGLRNVRTHVRTELWHCLPVCHMLETG